MLQNIIIAIAKGRVFEDALPLLAKLDIYPDASYEKTRKLILETNHLHVKIIIIRAIDVPTYVQYGAADLGIVGKDVLLEFGNEDLYELLDLNIACCKMVVAGPAKEIMHNNRLRVATKYPMTVRNHFARLGQQVQIIHLSGAMELAPVLGLADQIVDLVETGNTLKAHGLSVFETICQVSSVLIANKGAMKMKIEMIKPLLEKLTQIVAIA